jgi:hypothetical protein
MVGDFNLCQSTINEVIEAADEQSWNELIYSLYRLTLK